MHWKYYVPCEFLCSTSSICPFWCLNTTKHIHLDRWFTFFFNFHFICLLFLCPFSPCSHTQVPFTTMLALLCMWFGISMPLVYLGYYFGFRKQPYDNPVRTNQIPRQVPEQRWYMNKFVGWVINQSNCVPTYGSSWHGYWLLWNVGTMVLKCIFCNLVFFLLLLESWWLEFCPLVPCLSSSSSFSVWVQLLRSFGINWKLDQTIPLW